MSNLLTIANLTLRTADTVLVENLSLSIAPGERLGLIGESGSGKSLTATASVGLLPPAITAQGSIVLDGIQVIGTPDRDLVRLRGSAAAFVFQEPLTALDPLMKIGKQIAEPVRRRRQRQGQSTTGAEITAEVHALLDKVALKQVERIAQSYPHEISGGQRQRVAIAMALACQAKLLIADEPTTALDVTTQAEILRLLDSLVRETGMALLFISHDLPVVASIVERVAVLRHGKLVEEGPAARVLGQPEHDYTKALVHAAQRFDDALEGRP